MSWNILFNSEVIPSFGDIEKYVGEGFYLWNELISYIEKVYQVQPKLAYSKCSAQPGWNVKYQKSGKSLVTLYPMDGYFIVLVVIGSKEETEVELSLETLTPYVSGLYKKTPFSCGGHWLMIDVKDKYVLGDVKNLISIRVKPKRKNI